MKDDQRIRKCFELIEFNKKQLLVKELLDILMLTMARNNQS